jgi:RNA polymerase sigma-70 factor (ECF subfamily)
MAVSQATLTLVQAAKSGDDAAFEVLLEPLLEPAYRLANGMLHDHHAAEDVVQEAAIKAWRKIAHLRAGSEMRPWFFGIVANECRSAMRTRWWSVLLTVLPEGRQESGDETVLEGIEVRRALKRLPKAKRLVLVLHGYLDLPLEEIAEVLGTTTHAAESRLVRATQDFKRRMEATHGRR